jgi:hypothetical protein
MNLVLESNMKKSKVFLFAVIGAVCGVTVMFAIYPILTKYIVGPISGEDQMSQNAAILFAGVPVCMLIGAALGGVSGWKRQD